MLETQTPNSQINTAQAGLTKQTVNATGDIDDAIESLTQWAERVLGQDELIAARDEFFALFGKVFHDDPFFGARMSYFHNFFLFDRALRREDARAASPIRFYLDTNPERRDAAAIQAVHELSLCMHGIFMVKKLKGDQGTFINLLTGDLVPVRLPRSYRLFGLGKNQIIQGFLFRTLHGYHPAAGMIFHPEGSQKAIKKFIKSLPKDSDSDTLPLLGKFASTQLKSVRMKHVDAKTIYKMELL